MTSKRQAARPEPLPGFGSRKSKVQWVIPHDIPREWWNVIRLTGEQLPGGWLTAAFGGRGMYPTARFGPRMRALATARMHSREVEEPVEVYRQSTETGEMERIARFVRGECVE